MKSFSTPRIFVIGVCCICIAPLPSAWAVPPSSSSSGSQRDTSAGNELLMYGQLIVVTASKTPERVQDSPAAVSVITADDIRNSGATSIVDLLRSVPGVDVIEPNKSEVDVSIRGFNQEFADKLLVMIDGRSIYQDIAGSVDWNTEPILLTRIKRIEIVRGPGSVLYGANAFSGVINIIMKSPQEMAAEKPATAIAAYGEQNSTYTEVSQSGGKPKGLTYTVAAGYRSTDGFGSDKLGGVSDSSRIRSLTADLEQPVSNGVLHLSASDSSGRIDIQSLAALQDTSSVSLDYSQSHVTNPITIRGYGNFLWIGSNDAGVSHIVSDTYDLDVQQQRAVGRKNSLIYGGNLRTVQVLSTLTGSSARRQQLSGFYVQDQYDLWPNTSLFAGLRRDNDSEYGSAFSPHASLVQHLTKGQTIRLSYSTAYRAPSLTESYSNQSFPLSAGLSALLTGNPELKPETISSTEVGYRRDLAQGYYGVSLYDNQISNLIGLVITQFQSAQYPAGTPAVFQYQNISSAHAMGVELEGGFKLSRAVRGTANYSYQDVTYQNGEPVSLSPHHKINLTLQADLNTRLSAYLAAHFVGSSTYDDESDHQQQISAYTRIDARLGYRLGMTARLWTVSVAATNLFDNQHYDVPSVESVVPSAPQGRTLWGMLSFNY